MNNKCFVKKILKFLAALIILGAIVGVFSKNVNLMLDTFIQSNDNLGKLQI
jgi:hypothetical protein